MKNNKGITLIALVITIIILIILAGISIAMLMGENGIITKAKQGALNYQNAAAEEQAMLNNFYGDFASGVASATGDLSAVTHIDTNAATSDKILKDYKAYVNGELLTGTMNNYSQNIQSVTLTSDHTSNKEYEISSGYHEKIKIDASAVYEAGVVAGQSENGATLLWTNPNPTSPFAAQTISLDLSKYEAFIIGGKGWPENSDEEFAYVTKNTKYYAFGYENQSTKLFGGNVGGRNITITDSGITFTTGMRSNEVTGSGYGVPYHIWGLKNSII